MDSGDLDKGIPEDAIRQIVCFVGSPTIRLSDSDATRAYSAANPTWSRSHTVKLLYSLSELGSKQECILKCIEAIAKNMAKAETVIQARNVEITNLGRGLQLCFATIFGRSEKTNMFMSDDEIPFT